jgi:hypothetical protein
MTAANGLLLAGGWGGLNVDIDVVEYGITITTEQAAARYRRTVYVIRTIDSAFSITMKFSPRQKYNEFTTWMAGYLRAVSDGSAYPMRVVCPARGIDNIGVPLGIPLGDRAGKFLYEVTLDFLATTDPQGITSGLFSEAYGTTVDPEVNYMLPYGFQLTVWDPGSYIAPPLPTVAPAPVVQPKFTA